MESIILSASIMLTMRFFMISSPLSVDLSGYTPQTEQPERTKMPS